MAKAPKSRPSQRERFIEAARAAGVDDDEASFEKSLKAVAVGRSSAGATTKKPKASNKK